MEQITNTQTAMELATIMGDVNYDKSGNVTYSEDYKTGQREYWKYYNNGQIKEYISVTKEEDGILSCTTTYDESGNEINYIESFDKSQSVYCDN